jgi:hypothetical protein
VTDLNGGFPLKTSLQNAIIPPEINFEENFQKNTERKDQ